MQLASRANEFNQSSIYWLTILMCLVGSKVDLLTAWSGTLSTLEELSVLGLSPALGRSDPLKVKLNSRFITEENHHISYQILFLLQLIFWGV